jgi:hypothetical protein
VNQFLLTSRYALQHTSEESRVTILRRPLTEFSSINSYQLIHLTTLQDIDIRLDNGIGNVDIDFLARQAAEQDEMRKETRQKEGIPVHKDASVRRPAISEGQLTMAPSLATLRASQRTHESDPLRFPG